MPDAGEVYSWDGQMGGIEGLNQDTWVFVYIEQIRYALRQIAYPSYIFCKGDDLRIHILVPPEVVEARGVDKIRHEVLSHVSKEAGKFGHKIKVEDSYGSTKYFAFSKDAYISNIELSQTLRKITKVYGANNAFITTTDEYIASSFSNAHSASRFCPSPVPCYKVATFWALMAISKNPIYKDLADDELVCLLLVPNLLGGMPIIYLHNFFVRSESDLLTSFLDLRRYCLKVFPQVGRLMDKWLVQVISDPEKSIVGLFEDPYSLCIVRPEPPQTYLRKEVCKLIKSATKNETIKQLKECDADGYTAEVVKTLTNCNIYNSKIMSVIYGSTPTSIINEHCRKFESGRSVFDAFILQNRRRKGLRILAKSIYKDRLVHEYRICCLKGKLKNGTHLLMGIHSEACSTEQAQYIRDSTWGRTIEGVTNPSIIHMIKVIDTNVVDTRDPHILNSHFDYHFTPFTKGDPSHILFNVTDSMPFVGKTTGRGLTPPTAPLTKDNVIARKVKELLDIYIWSLNEEIIDDQVVTSNLGGLIESILYTYTGKRIVDLAPFLSHKAIGKTAHQRLKAHNFRTSIVPNTLSNLYTHVKGDSASHITIKNTPDNFKINFLQVYCHVVSIWAMRIWCAKPHHQSSRLWGVTTRCNYCTSPIHETPIIIPQFCLPNADLVSYSDLGGKAVNNVIQELDDYIPPEFYIPEEGATILSYSDAVSGLIQYNIDTTLSIRSELQMTYTKHHLKESGVDALTNWHGKVKHSSISWDDLSSTPIETIIDGMVWTVLGEVMKITRKHSDMSDITSLIAMIPSEELPWSPILAGLKEAGRLYDLQRYIINKCPKFSNLIYDNYLSLSPIVGSMIYQTNIDKLSGNIIPIVKWDIDRDAAPPSSFLMKIRSIRVRMLLRNHIIPMLTSAGQNLCDDASMLRALVAASVEDVEDLYYSWITSTEGVITGKIYPYRVIDFRETYMGLSGIDDDDMPDLMRFLINSTPTLNWESLFERLQDGELDDLASEVELAHSEFSLVNSIQVVYINPLLCADIVRANRKYPKTQELGIFDEHAPGIPIIYNVTGHHIKLKHQGKVIAGKGVELPTSLHIASTEDQTPFNERWKYRTSGSSNISMSKCMSLLSQLNIKSLPPRSIVLCLADGYGGNATVLSAITDSSRIVYNTFPNTFNVIPQAIFAEGISQGRRNTIDDDLLRRGVYDLKMDSTRSAFMHHYPSTTLIFCDAEEVNNESKTLFDLYKNVILVAVNTLSGHGVLIVKIYYQHLHYIESLIAFCCRKFISCFIIQCHASALNGELYLVCQSVRYRQMMLSDDIPHVSEHLDAGNHRRVFNLCQRLISQIENHSGGILALKLHQIEDDWERGLIRLLPNHGLSKLQEVCKVVLPSYAKNTSKDRLTQWGVNLVTILNDVKHTYLKEINGTEHSTIRARYDTLAHNVVIINRYLILSGVIFAITELTGSAQKMTYEGLMDSIRKDLRNLTKYPMLSNMSDNNIRDYNYQFLFHRLCVIQGYILGSRWGMSIVTGALS